MTKLSHSFQNNSNLGRTVFCQRSIETIRDSPASTQDTKMLCRATLDLLSKLKVSLDRRVNADGTITQVKRSAQG